MKRGWIYHWPGRLTIVALLLCLLFWAWVGAKLIPDPTQEDEGYGSGVLVCNNEDYSPAGRALWKKNKDLCNQIGLDKPFIITDGEGS